MPGQESHLFFLNKEHEGTIVVKTKIAARNTLIRLRVIINIQIYTKY